jgi:hypothetical protein
MSTIEVNSRYFAFGSGSACWMSALMGNPIQGHDHGPAFHATVAIDALFPVVPA